MHIASIFHCPSRADARELGFNLAQYNLSLIEAMLERDSTLRVDVITSQEGQPLLLRPSLGAAVESGALTIRPLLKRSTISLLSMAWRVQWRNFTIAHFQHETFHYGGPLSVYAFPFLLLWLRLWTNPVATLHHIVDARNFTRAFTALFASRLPPTVIRWGYALFYQLVGWMASSIIVHEPCDLQILSEQYKVQARKIAVIAHGAADCPRPPSFDVAASRAQFGVPPDAERVYGFFSYFDLSKGIDVLIPEFLEYLKTHPRDVLVIAGTRNPYHLQHTMVEETMDALRARSEREGGGRIVWIGFLSPERAMTFYHVVDCIVAPYRIFNGGSAAIAKSIGARVPILLSDSFAPCIRNPEFLFSLSGHSLLSALRSFADTPDRRTEIMEQIDIWRRERLWPSVGQKTLAHYQTLCAHQSVEILLLGAYGQKNLGDELLLDECLRHLPRGICTVASVDPQETVASHAVQAVPSRLSFKLLCAFFRARALIVGGGDQFKLLKPTMGRSRHSLLLREALLVLCAKMLRKNFSLVGVGIGDISTRLAHVLTWLILRLADAVVLRDHESAETARRLAPSGQVTLGADLAFLRRERQTFSLRPSGFGRQAGFSLTNSLFPERCGSPFGPEGPQGLNGSAGTHACVPETPATPACRHETRASPQLFHCGNTGQTEVQPPKNHQGCPTILTLGIAPACHWDDLRVSSHVAQELARALDGLLASAPDHRALFLPFQAGPRVPNDLRIIWEIRSSMKEQDRCRTESALSLTTVGDVYQSLQCLWGMRLHSLILATLHAVPFIALIYDVKVRRFLEEIGCSEWGIPLDVSFSADTLLALQQRLQARLPEIRQHLRKQAERLGVRAQVDAQLLRDIAADCDTSVLPQGSSTSSETDGALSPSDFSP